MKAGTLVVSDRGRELGRLDIPEPRKGFGALKTLVRKNSGTMSLPAGTRDLTFVYTTKDGHVATQAASHEFIEGRTTSVKVDVGYRGRALDVVFD